MSGGAQTVRLSVLGAGSWTCVNHLPLLAARSDVRLVSCADPLANRRDSVANAFAFDLVTADVGEALAARPDVVVVGSTPDAHFQLVEAALATGCHVLCEKPFTESAAQAWSLVDQASSLGLHLLTAFGWNYSPMTLKVEELMTRVDIGRVEHVQIHMATALREMYQATSPVWGRPPEFEPIPSSYTNLAKGAGYAQAQLTHAVGLALHLRPDRASSVFAYMSNPGAEVDLHCSIATKMVSGATYSVSGACSPKDANDNKHQLELRFFGSDGQVLLDYDRELAWAYRNDGTSERLDLAPGDGAYTCEGPANTLIDLALGKQVKNRSDGRLAAITTEFIQAAYDSWLNSGESTVRIQAGNSSV